MAKETPTTGTSEPKTVVLAAYHAANLGQYSKANGFLAPSFVRSLVLSRAATLAGWKKARRSLMRLRGRRDDAAVQSRRTLRAVVKSYRMLTSLQLGSTAYLRRLWRWATRGRSLVRVEVTRQVVRGSRARVHLKLYLRDGTVARDSEPLVRQGGRWFLE